MEVKSNTVGLLIFVQPLPVMAVTVVKGQVVRLSRAECSRVPDDGAQQSGPGLVVEGDDDTRRRKILSVLPPPTSATQHLQQQSINLYIRLYTVYNKTPSIIQETIVPHSKMSQILHINIRIFKNAQFLPQPPFSC